MLGRNVSLSAAISRMIASGINLGDLSLDGIGYKNAKPHKAPNGKKPSGAAASKRLAAKRNNIRKHG